MRDAMLMDDAMESVIKVCRECAWRDDCGPSFTGDLVTTAGLEPGRLSSPQLALGPEPLTAI
ncbi:hypothetical protein MPTK1_4g17460 [Marchantia polymorpha subsp. ruderalis]|uniref:Uncharacterized protein n=2 Tax=Marchantia polymorpha TaxID=3197 RepID=A0AAF6BAV4_MARPO|nr:hypothetical protein MARPO_0041s0028 [Marchantia polymorpha]BBN09138.1 hypothetical protein Mp_4g17460 [Marchantia polymorpha subsp. ruderalis]|eukprot:PTQ40126.1 hypothetical protein MARPO_0041s0028 [Marchantia polymorpha]